MKKRGRERKETKEGRKMATVKLTEQQLWWIAFLLALLLHSLS